RKVSTKTDAGHAYSGGVYVLLLLQPIDGFRGPVLTVGVGWQVIASNGFACTWLVHTQARYASPGQRLWQAGPVQKFLATIKAIAIHHDGFSALARRSCIQGRHDT